MHKKLVAVSLLAFVPSAARADSFAASSGSLASPALPVNTQIAQAAPPQFLPTDITPFTKNRALGGGRYKFRLFQGLPERLWFDSSTEVSQRLDTNVFLTHGNYKPDYVFRVAPNLTVGYNVLKNTSIYANYFLLKDTFATHSSLSNPTVQSLGWGVQHHQQIGEKTQVQYDFQARELWQASHLHQFDFLPGVTVTRTLNPSNIVFASALLQLRGGNYFVAPTREIDPFFTVGYVCRRGLWSFIANDTLVLNFRDPPFNDAIPPTGNINMIADFEINRPVARNLPALVAFVRAEPVWNWRGNKEPGLSGFDFRLYGGMRLSFGKPAYYATVDNLRKQLMKSESGGGE